MLHLHEGPDRLEKTKKPSSQRELNPGQQDLNRRRVLRQSVILLLRRDCPSRRSREGTLTAGRFRSFAPTSRRSACCVRTWPEGPRTPSGTSTGTETSWPIPCEARPSDQFGSQVVTREKYICRLCLRLATERSFYSEKSPTCDGNCPLGDPQARRPCTNCRLELMYSVSPDCLLSSARTSQITKLLSVFSDFNFAL